MIRMLMNNELGRMQVETVFAKPEVLSHDSPGVRKTIRSSHRLDDVRTSRIQTGFLSNLTRRAVDEENETLKSSLRVL
jgi:hypothetical protein